MKILHIVGARPQFIKAAVLHRVFQQKHLEEVFLHTGQHYDANMSQLFFEELHIPPPQYNLEIGGCSHGAMTGRMLEGIEKVLEEEQPTWVIVYGDTNSTLAGALAAVKMHIPLAHVEAGLRSFNRAMSEEINRILTDQCADLLFTPTDSATQHLIREGVSRSKICQAGDVMYDAAHFYQEKAQKRSTVLKDLQIKPQEYILVTCHRAENTDDESRLRAIVDGLVALATQVRIVLPLHPRTRGALEKVELLDRLQEYVSVIDPIGYLDMVMLESHAKMIVTDSGGMQKEAYFFHVPCLVLRDETEWVELVEKGCHVLVDVLQDDFVEKYLLVTNKTYDGDLHLYGKGDAGQRMAEALLGD